MMRLRPQPFYRAFYQLLAAYFCLCLATEQSAAAESNSTKSTSELEYIFDDIPHSLFSFADSYAAQILEECPPEDCVLVSFGVTNTLLDAHLRVRMLEKGIPDTYLRYLPTKRVAMLTVWPESDQNNFLSRLLPSSQELQGKTVMFLRTLNYGVSVHNVLPMIRKYYQSQNFRGKIGAFFVTNANTQRYVRTDFEKNLGELTGKLIVDVNETYMDYFAHRQVQTLGALEYASPFELYYRYEDISLTGDATEFAKVKLTERLDYKELDALVTGLRSCRRLISGSENK